MGVTVKVRVEEDEVILKMSAYEYYSLTKVLDEVSKMTGSATGLRARKLLESMVRVTEKKPSEMTLQELRDYIQEHVPYFMGLKIYVSRKKIADGKDYEWIDVYVSRNRRTTIHGWADMLYNNENPVDRAVKMVIERSKKECGKA